MEGKPDPGFALADEDFFPLCASLSKILGLRPFHGHNVAVLQMADAPYAAHSAFDGAGNHLVCAHQSIILEEALRRNRILPVKDAAVILIQASFTYRKINAIRISHSSCPFLGEKRVSSDVFSITYFSESFDVQGILLVSVPNDAPTDQK